MKTKKLSEVKGYEEYDDYLVTNLGDVISHKFGKTRVLKKTAISGGYLQIELYNHGNHEKKYIHKIVARAFCKGYSEELEVDHINEIKTDNKAFNLQYLTHKKNMWKSFNKPVAQLTLKGKLVKKCKSGAEAQQQCNFNASNISKVCLGKLKTSGGFKWCFAD